MNSSINNFKFRAYSLVEVLAASAILLMALSAVISLSYGTVAQEENNQRVARGYCIQENIAQLFCLGLSPDDIVNVLPTGSEGIEVEISDTTSLFVDDLFLEAVDVTVKLKPIMRGAERTDTTTNIQVIDSVRTLGPIKIYRPSFR